MEEFDLPDEEELFAFFGSEPIERNVDDGYWCYETKYPDGRTIRFSIMIYERSVQTEIRLGGLLVARVSHENAKALTLTDRQLRCEFFCTDCHTSLTIDADQSHSVTWSTLRTR